ncbi:metallophosphoesterase [Microbacterium sp. CH1]|uniref:metallophosphoesterase n=1 Tax=Microbacterium sp. CH1 TaxID=1770208 RepID=UPI0009EF1ABA|nr:metallophosphoesterase [Microbacterium sp. CH1]
MRSLAFVGDVHGSIEALEGILDSLREGAVDHLVFLGDYINKGPSSSGVLDRLVPMMLDGSATLLRGNHEAELLRAVDTQDLRVFLKMGGAATIRSYVGDVVGAEVFSEFHRALPAVHLDAIRAMPRRFSAFRIMAQHEPLGAPAHWNLGKFVVTAHRPSGMFPKVRWRSAEIDTGCGDEGGRLTAFLWPSREYIQVDLGGSRV